MGFSVSVAFAILFTAALVSAGMLYVAVENTYTQVSTATSDYNSAFLKAKTSMLEAGLYNYSTISGISLYNVTFNITNRGTTLSPGKWSFIYDGNLVTTSGTVEIEYKTYLLPGEVILLTVQNVPKDSTIHSLVVSTETGCSLKIKWEWTGNTTVGEPELILSAWYCPVEGW